MRIRTLTKFIPAVAAILLMGQACPIQFSSGNVNDGGLWRTDDRGAHWVQKNAVLSVGGAQTMAPVTVITMQPDPQDPKTIYLGTGESGLLYSLNGGESWAQPTQLGSGRFPSIAVDYKNKCAVYAVNANRVIKTTDCGRTWAATFQDSRELTLTSIAVDHFNSMIVYLTTSSGDILKSTDAGFHWATAKVFPSAAQKVLVNNPGDSRILYVGTKSDGVWKSTDAGNTWVDVSKDLAQFDGAKDFYDLVPDLSKDGSFILVSRYGFLRTIDGGTHWEKVPLLTPPGSARIYSAALNPKNGGEMYYSTATIFYSSSNGGVNWTTKKLPTSRAGSSLYVSADNANQIFLGTLLLKK